MQADDTAAFAGNCGQKIQLVFYPNSISLKLKAYFAGLYKLINSSSTFTLFCGVLLAIGRGMDYEEI